MVMGKTFGELRIRGQIWVFGKLGESDEFFKDSDDPYKSCLMMQTDGFSLNNMCENCLFLTKVLIYMYTKVLEL